VAPRAKFAEIGGHLAASFKVVGTLSEAAIETCKYCSSSGMHLTA